LRPVKDCNHHTACFVDHATGYVEAMYKGQTTSTYLTVGKSFEILRDDARTVVTRVPSSEMKVERYRVAA